MKNVTTAETYKSIRKHWGNLSPITKRIDSLKRYNRKVKHKHQDNL